MILATALYAVLAGVMWLPFGLRTTGLVEEWDLMWLNDRGAQMWWLTESSPLASLRLRPMFGIPYELAYTLGGGGFIWLNVFALIVFVALGVGTFLLVERLAPGRRSAAISAGALAMLYPANDGLFTFRVLHIRAATVLFVLALVLLCDLVRQPRWWRFGLMSVFLASSLLIYQIAAVALVVGPLAVLMTVGTSNLAALLRYSALWFAAPSAVGCYWLFVAAHGGTYEFESASGARPGLGSYANDLLGAYLDQIFRAWRPETWVTWDPAYVVLGLACGVLVGAIAFLAQGSSRLSTRGSLIGGIGALALAPLGFLPLWAIVYSIHETLKVYVLSSVAVSAGVALVLASVCRSRAIFAVVGGALTAVAAIYGLHQHAHYEALSDAQTRVLGSFVEQFPAPADDTTLIVRDQSGWFSQVWTLGPPVTFAAAVASTYRNPTLRVVLCDEATGSAFENGELVRGCPDGRPMPDDPDGGRAVSVRPDRLAVFDYDVVRELRLARRRSGSLPAGYAPESLAARGRKERGELFACRPIRNCTDPPSAQWPRGTIDESFGPETVNVTGFRSSEKAPDGRSFRWTISPRVHVYGFLPERDAAFDMRVLAVIHPAVAASIRVRVNDRLVPVDIEPFGSGLRLRAMISGEALRASPDDIEIASDVAPVAGSLHPLGIAVSRLVIEPQPGG